MFKFIIIFYFFISNFSWACEGNQFVRHVNPDGSRGGFVNINARVDSQAYIGLNAKVCDQSWVEGNVYIKDNAVIRGNAWIKSYTTVSGNSIVYGNALTSGEKNSFASVGGNARVFENAKIFSGSVIKDNSEVYGSVSISDSVISDNAKVCRSFQIRGQEISDNYFCDEENLSAVKLQLSNLSESKLNSSKQIIELTSDTPLSEYSSSYVIELNNQRINSDYILISTNKLKIRTASLNKEGMNSLSVVGIDRYGKSFEYHFTYIVGSETHMFHLQSAAVKNVRAKLFVEGVEYLIESKINGSEIYLLNVPSEISGYEKIQLSFLSNNRTYNFYEVQKLSEIPSELSDKPVPIFENNSGEFLNQSWVISDSSKINITSEGAELFFPESGEVTLFKTFKLNSSNPSIFFKTFSDSEFNILDANFKVDFTMVSLYDGSVQREFTNLMELRELGINPDQYKIKFTKNKNLSEEEFVVIIKLSSLEQKNFLPKSIKLKNGELSEVDINFKPYNVSFQNKLNRSLIDNSPILNSLCNNTSFNLPSRYFQSSIEEMKFFSGGNSPIMPGFVENRIWGDLSFTNVNREDIEEVRLVIYQFDRNTQTIKLIIEALSVCTLEDFNNPTEFPPREAVQFFPSTNIIRPLFSIPAYKLGNIDTSAGQKITMYVEADIRNQSGGFEKVTSSQVRLPVLKTSWLPASYSYGDTEDYNTNAQGKLRTGGDKWALPSVADRITYIINNFSNPPFYWKMGDLGKLNGGEFLGHKSTHRDGRDVDISFKKNIPGGLNFDFNMKVIDTGDYPSWDKFLDGLEQFLINIEFEYDYIRDIYTQRTPESEKFMNVRFANRCFRNSRFINFESGNGQGSLLRDVPPDHWHHFHIRYNPLDAYGFVKSIDKGTKPSNDLNEFVFELSADQKLSIRPLNPSNFANKIVMWRFQSSLGYDDFDMNLEIGRWGGPSMSIFGKNKNIKRYIYLTIGNRTIDDERSSGGCIQREIEIDSSKGLKKWTYVKKGNSYEPIPYAN